MAIRGRGNSVVKTPLLVMDYLAGEVFPLDTDGQASSRLSEGDYEARIHRQVKLRIKELNPHYQYPRSHSFHTFINHLITLGLVEKTGRREEGELEIARGFRARTWVRLTPGSQNRPEWADPMGYIANIYGAMRVPGAVLPEAPTRIRPKKKPPSPQERKRGRREKRRALITPAIEELEGMRQGLVSDLLRAAKTGGTLDVFEPLADRAQAFIEALARVYRPLPFLDAREDVGALRGCITIWRQAGGGGVRLTQAKENCRAAANVLAVDISTPLPPVEEREEEVQAKPGPPWRISTALQKGKSPDDSVTPEIAQRLRDLTPAQRRNMIEEVKQSTTLSAKGKSERLAILLFPPRQLPIKPPLPQPTPPAESGGAQLIEQAHARLSAKKPNLRTATHELDELEMKHGLDVADARDALTEYENIERSDFEPGAEGADEFKEARQEAYDEFLEALENTEVEEED